VQLKKFQTEIFICRYIKVKLRIKSNEGWCQMAAILYYTITKIDPLLQQSIRVCSIVTNQQHFSINFIQNIYLKHISHITQHNSVIILHINAIIKALHLCHQGALQYDPSLLVPLCLLRRELVDPPKLCLAALAGHVADHMASGQHDPVLDLTEAQVDDPVEEERTPGSACEPGGYELGAVGQGGLTAGAEEQPRTTEMFKEYPPHGRNRVW